MYNLFINQECDSVGALTYFQQVRPVPLHSRMWQYKRGQRNPLGCKYGQNSCCTILLVTSRFPLDLQNIANTSCSALSLWLHWSSNSYSAWEYIYNNSIVYVYFGCQISKITFTLFEKLFGLKEDDLYVCGCKTSNFSGFIESHRHGNCWTSWLFTGWCGRFLFRYSWLLVYALTIVSTLYFSSRVYASVADDHAVVKAQSYYCWY